MSKYNILNAATATGAGSEVGFGKSQEILTFQVDATGSPTAVVMDIEGSLDGTNFAQLAQHTFSADEIAAQLAIFHISGKPVEQIRANLTTLTGGTSPTVTVRMFE